MRYGFCTGQASPLTDAVDYALLERIKKAGFEYVEFPLILLEHLPDEHFKDLLVELDRLGLGCDCCCDMFPKFMPITGPGADRHGIGSYLKRAFNRAARIGTKKFVLGSASSRSLPKGCTPEEGYEQLNVLIRHEILPLCMKYGVHVVIEPIRSSACNFINTLPEGMALVNRVASPHVTLMADSLHMLNESEDPDHICEYFDSLDHVHISEAGRILPEERFSGEVRSILQRLKSEGYDKTISFETKPGNMEMALVQIRTYFASSS